MAKEETPPVEATEGPVAAPQPAPKAADDLVEVELTARFVNVGAGPNSTDLVYGQEPQEDENGMPVVTKVKVPSDVAEDLKRRQAEYDRSERDRFREHRFGRFTTPQR